MEKNNASPDYKGKPFVGAVCLFLGAVLFSLWPPRESPAQGSTAVAAPKKTADSATILGQQAEYYREEKRRIDSASLQSAEELKKLTILLRRQNNNQDKPDCGSCEIYGLVIPTTAGVLEIPVQTYRGYAIVKPEDLASVLPPVVKHDTVFVSAADTGRRSPGLWQKIKRIVSPGSKKEQ